jgi:hypothetical protein
MFGTLPSATDTLLMFADAAWERAMQNDVTEMESRALRAALILIATPRAAPKHMGLLEKWSD